VSSTSCVRQKICFERATAFSLPPQKGGEGRGEEALFINFPLSPTLSPLVPRGEREPKGRKRSACRTQQIENLHYSLALAPRWKELHKRQKPGLNNGGGFEMRPTGWDQANGLPIFWIVR